NVLVRADQKTDELRCENPSKKGLWLIGELWFPPGGADRPGSQQVIGYQIQHPETVAVGELKVLFGRETIRVATAREPSLMEAIIRPSDLRKHAFSTFCKDDGDAARTARLHSSRRRQRQRKPSLKRIFARRLYGRRGPLRFSRGWRPPRS